MAILKHPGMPRDYGLAGQGAVFFGGGGGGGNTTTVQKSDPWSGQQGYLKDVFGQAQNLFKNYSPQYFPNSTVAGLTPYQNAGINMEAAYGLNGGNSAVNASTNALTNFSNGNYLSAGNPYFQSMANNVMSSVVPGLESQFAQGNRMNSPGAAYAVSKGATDALGGLAYQNYNDQLGNMLKSSALAPTLQGADYQNIQALQDAGSQVQNQNQQQLTDQANRYDYYQQLPYQKLASYAGMVNGTGYGGTTTSTQPYYTNTGANLLSGGLSGAMLGSSLAGTLGISSGLASAGGAGLGALLAFL